MTSAVGELFHVDLIDKVLKTSSGGLSHVLTVVEDASGGSLALLLRKKSEPAAEFQNIMNFISNRIGHHVQRVRNDRGMEYFAEILQKYFNSNGIHHEPTTADSTKSNGKAEHINRTLSDRARAILAEKRKFRG